MQGAGPIRKMMTVRNSARRQSQQRAEARQMAEKRNNERADGAELPWLGQAFQVLSQKLSKLTRKQTLLILTVLILLAFTVFLAPSVLKLFQGDPSASRTQFADQISEGANSPNTKSTGPQSPAINNAGLQAGRDVNTTVLNFPNQHDANQDDSKKTKGSAIRVKFAGFGTLSPLSGTVGQYPLTVGSYSLHPSLTVFNDGDRKGQVVDGTIKLRNGAQDIAKGSFTIPVAARTVAPEDFRSQQIDVDAFEVLDSKSLPQILERPPNERSPVTVSDGTIVVRIISHDGSEQKITIDIPAGEIPFNR